MNKRYLLTVIIVCFLLLSFLVCSNLFAEVKTKYIILIKYQAGGFEKRVVYKLEDMFQMNYPADSPKHKIWILKSGEYIQSKDKAGPLYLIESSWKVAGKNEMLIIVRPYITPDPRSIHKKK